METLLIDTPKAFHLTSSYMFRRQFADFEADYIQKFGGEPYFEPTPKLLMYDAMLQPTSPCLTLLFVGTPARTSQREKPYRNQIVSCLSSSGSTSTS